MGNFLVRYVSRVVIYDHKAVIRLVTDLANTECRIFLTNLIPGITLVSVSLTQGTELLGGPGQCYFNEGQTRPLLFIFVAFQTTLCRKPS